MSIDRPRAPTPPGRATGPSKKARPATIVAAALSVLAPSAVLGQTAEDDPNPRSAPEAETAPAVAYMGTKLLERPVAGLLPDSLRTEVLVLGSTHLSRHADTFRPEHLDPLIAALEAWGPAAIGVERDPPGVYARIGAGDEPEAGGAMQGALGIGLERAVITADSLLAATSGTDDVSAETRLELVRHLVAAHRLPTAALHWTRLPADARSRVDLPEKAREALAVRTDGLANEIYSIGVRLARERGLGQVHPIDDHTSERVYDLEKAAAEGGLREILAGHPTYDSFREYRREGRRRTTEALESGDLLPFFRWKNDPSTVARDVRLQWGIFLELADETPMAQKRIAHWEIRNLKMVTHVRKMMLHHPGERILVVVGGGHKAFFDAYLDRMLDVEVVQLDEVLEAARATDPAAPEAGAGEAGDTGRGDHPHYRVDARIEPATGRIDVDLAMRWVPESPTDTLTFLLHRDLGRPTVESDAVAAVDVEPELRFLEPFDADTSHTNRVTVALARTATPGNPVELRWSYGGTLLNEHVRLGASLVTPHWIELQIGALWVPVARSLQEPFTYEAAVELPEGFEMVSVGAVEREGDTHRLRSTAPLPSVPIVASDRFRSVRPRADGPAVTVRHAGAADSLVTFVAGHAGRLLSLYDGMFRTGREVESLEVVIPPEPRPRSNAYARPGLIALNHDRQADRGTFMLLAHEAAHLWWRDADATQSRHNFLNESFAEYASFLAAREVYGEEVFRELVRGVREDAEGLPAIRDWSARRNRSLMYRKGPWLLHRLHERIGGEAFLRFVRALQRDGVGTLEGMIEVLRQATDAGTATWFDGRLSSGGSD